mgnify:CR=1 FL=1
MPDLNRLVDFLDRHQRLLVLTGAGLSTASGIPDYRDDRGDWKRQQPVQYADFVVSPSVRRRYWARSLIGWRHMHRARPNGAHHALVRLERLAKVEQLVTQNVDRLHQQAGSRDVIDLHGRIDRVICTGCRSTLTRAAFQDQLSELNPGWDEIAGTRAPDGDADLPETDFSGFTVPDCPSCGGIWKPDVVFFGEAVPKARSTRAMTALAAAHALLVIGTSLMVYSGFRFAREAASQGIPIVAVNIGMTRAYDLLAFMVPVRCDELLPGGLRQIG